MNKEEAIKHERRKNVKKSSSKLHIDLMYTLSIAIIYCEIKRKEENMGIIKIKGMKKAFGQGKTENLNEEPRLKDSDARVVATDGVAAFTANEACEDMFATDCDWVKDVEYGTEYTDVFMHPNANVLLKMYPSPINYVDENGRLIKIDGGFTSFGENVCGVRKSDCKIEILQNVQSDCVTVSDGQTEFTLSFGDSFVGGEIIEKDGEKRLMFDNSAGTVREIGTLKSGVTVNCVLKSAEEVKNFGFDLHVNKLRWENYSDSTTVFLNKDNLPKITLQTLALKDADDNFVLAKNKVYLNKKTIRVGVELDETYLASASYPLTLSMSAELYKNKLPDTTVYSKESGVRKHMNPVAYLGDTARHRYSLFEVPIQLFASRQARKRFICKIYLA